MKKTLLVLTSSLGLLAAGSGYATNLLEVYQQAVRSDPVYQAAEAQYLATRENIPITRSYLLPQINASGTAAQYHQDSQSRPLTSVSSLFSNVGQGGFDYYSNTWAVTLQQTLFNYQAWETLVQAKTTAKAAFATYTAVAQNLISRVTTAYFNVLLAEDNLRFVLAEKAAVYQQLDQVRQKFKVGLLAITGVYQAQAQYDSILAEEIAARNSIVNATENLRVITNVYYKDLDGLKMALPLIKPDPIDVKQWVQTAQRQNWTLNASRLTTKAAQEEISIEQAGHYPTLYAVGQYQVNRTGETPSGILDDQIANIGIQLNLPIYQGGLISAQTQQARYNYEEALANTEEARRVVVNDTHQSYNDIISNISQIKADQQAILSNESSLLTTSEAYKVGTETMLDVLQAQQNLFNAELAYSQDEYNYLNAMVALKQAAGTLSVSDVQELNSWLVASNESYSAVRAREMIQRLQSLNSNATEEGTSALGKS